MKKRRSLGLSTGGILVLIAIMAVLAAALARIVVSHLYLETRSLNSDKALNLARSASARAVAELIENQAYGADDPENALIELRRGQGEAVVTFSQAEAERRGVACSSNNLESVVALEAPDGKSVKAGTVRIWATGTQGGVTRTIESVVEIPRFPWAIAAGGEIQTDQGVLIGSLPEGVWPPVLDELLPADLLSNDQTDRAIVLGGQTTVLGDVETAGRVSVDPSTVVVEGAVLEKIAPVDIPVLEAASQDPLLKGITFDDLSDVSTAAPLTVTGAARSRTSLHFSSGLTLNGAHLYVDGDLSVRGNIQGEGVIVATGDVTFTGFADLQGATKLAILADGTVRLRGLGPGTSRFRGTVYGGQGVEASHMTLVGSLIGGKRGAGVTVSDTYLIAEPVQTPELSKEFYIGTLDPNNPRYHDESVSDTPPDSGYLISIKVSREQSSEFPIEVEFSYRGQSPYTWTIAGPAQIGDVQGQISWLLDDWTQIPRDAWVETILDRYPLSTMTDQITSGQVSSDSSGDLSLLIPVKDRIRMVSCYER